MTTRFGLASDHAGFDLKLEIKKYLEDEFSIETTDFGTYSRESTATAPYAEKLGVALLKGEIDYGILICGTGVGMSIAANKIPGVRAAVCSEPFSASMAKMHNNANVLCFGARVVGLGLAKLIVKAYVENVYEGGRHAERNAYLEVIEDKSDEYKQLKQDAASD
mgnify:CR=1 FL=1